MGKEVQGKRSSYLTSYKITGFFNSYESDDHFPSRLPNLIRKMLKKKNELLIGLVY